MSGSWWELGEYSGRFGNDLAINEIECAFCFERGKFSVEHHAVKRQPNGPKTLNFDTLKCGSCGGYVLVLWSATSHMIGLEGIHAYKVLPWPIRVSDYPDDWPEAIGRYWMQAHRSLNDENWDAAAVMARSAMQAALRENGAVGTSLKQEVEDLAAKGILPPLMKDWSHELRELGNESAHPVPTQGPTSPRDARDVVEYLDFMLQYLYTLPKQIEDYRQRKA